MQPTIGAGGRRFEKLHASLPLAPTLTGACIACSPQGAYSTAVYGAPDRVDLDALRIVHTSMWRARPRHVAGRVRVRAGVRVATPHPRQP